MIDGLIGQLWNELVCKFLVEEKERHHQSELMPQMYRWRSFVDNTLANVRACLMHISNKVWLFLSVELCISFAFTHNIFSKQKRNEISSIVQIACHRMQQLLWATLIYRDASKQMNRWQRERERERETEWEREIAKNEWIRRIFHQWNREENVAYTICLLTARHYV
jgi:hypothetical protein